MSYSVGEVSRLAGVTVRTLHHYDQIGLLSPSGRTSAGYRRYSKDDLERLQQIMYYRELGFALDEIATILDDPEADAMAHFRRQHELVTSRIERLRAMVASIEFAMEAHEMGISLTPEERFEVFGEADPAQYAEEVQERWGDTDAYRQSRARTSGYCKADWERIQAEGMEIDSGLVAALRDGTPANGERAMALAEAHRVHISRWFYDCGYPMHRCLADMYLADHRFTERYEALAAGLAQYVHDAVHANADRAEGA